MSVDGDRRAEKRARYLDRTTSLERREALTVAYSELGYSSHGIADKLDATPGTVSTYLDRATARFGPQAVLQHAPDVDDLEPVDAETVLDWNEELRQWWLDIAREHPDVVPSEVEQHL
jgi:DNA-binding CsgD family transcriptional regulator